MSLTISDAARHAHVSQGTITKLLKAGHLKAVQDGPHKHWRISTPKADIKKLVAEHSPGSGWKKNGSPKAKKPTADGSLREVLAFAALDAPTRAALLALAERFPADDLQILLSL